jgi:hypothetical protein
LNIRLEFFPNLSSEEGRLPYSHEQNQTYSIRAILLKIEDSEEGVNIYSGTYGTYINLKVVATRVDYKTR